MAVKQLAISFGIGATIAGGFASAFKSANATVDSVNKRILDLKKTQESLKNFESLKTGLQNIAKEMEITSKSIVDLNGELKVNSDKNKELQKTYNNLGNEMKKTENNISSIKLKMSELDGNLKKNKENTDKLKLEERRLKEEMKNTSTEGAEKLKNKLTDLRADILKNEDNALKLRTEYSKLGKELKSSSEELEPLKKKMKDVTKEIQDNSTKGNQLEKSYKNLENRSQQLKNSYSTQENKINSVSEALKNQGISIEDTSKAYDELNQKSEKYNNILKKYDKAKSISEKGGKVSSFGTGVIGIGGAVTGIGVNVAKSAIKAESSFADVKKQFDFKDKDEEEKFKTELQKIVTEKGIAISQEDLYGMAATAGQSGIGQEEAISYVEQAAKMAVAFDMSREDAAKNMFIWKNAFGMDLTQLKELGDQINILGNNTGATETQISDFITRMGNIPKMAGMAENQTAALGATLIEMGMAPEVAATGAKKLFNTLTAGKAATGTEAKAFDMLGINPRYLAKMTQQDPEKAMEKVFQRLGKLKKEDQGAVMKMLFGEEGKVAGSNIMNAYEKYKKNLSLVKDKNIYEGAQDKEFENKNNTVENKLQNLKTQFDFIKADLGTELLPVIQDLAKYGTEFAKKITKLMKENPEGVKKLVMNLVKLTVGLYGAGLAIKAIGLGMKGWSMGLKTVAYISEKEIASKVVNNLVFLKKGVLSFGKTVGSGIIGFGKTAGKAMVTLGKIGMTALASPVTWIIAGILALVAAGYLLYKNWDKVKEKTAGLRKAIGELIDKYWFLMGPLGYVLKAGRLVYQNWDTIMEKGGELKEYLVNMVAGWIENWDSFKEKSENVLGVSFDWIKEKWNSVKDTGAEVIDFFIEAYSKIDGFFTKVGEKWEGVKSFGASKWDQTKSFFGFGEEAIPGYATGGIVTSPTLAMIGEGGNSESIIPLTKNANSLSLWEKTGRFLGAYDSRENLSNGLSEFNFTYAPVIHANNVAGVEEALIKDKEISYNQFKNYFERYQREVYRKGGGR